MKNRSKKNRFKTNRSKSIFELSDGTAEARLSRLCDEIRDGEASLRNCGEIHRAFWIDEFCLAVWPVDGLQTKSIASSHQQKSYRISTGGPSTSLKAAVILDGSEILVVIEKIDPGSKLARAIKNAVLAIFVIDLEEAAIRAAAQISGDYEAEE